MADQPDHATGVRLDTTDAAELVELLTFLGDWFNGRDRELLAASLARFVAHPGYDLPALQASLARFAFLLGDDGDRLFGPVKPATPATHRASSASPQRGPGGARTDDNRWGQIT